MKILKTQRELADKIANTINIELNLNLFTIDIFAMSKIIQIKLKENRYYRLPERFWKENPDDYTTIIIYEDGKTNENIISVEDIDNEEGNLMRDDAIQKIVTEFNAKKL